MSTCDSPCSCFPPAPTLQKPTALEVRASVHHARDTIARCALRNAEAIGDRELAERLRLALSALDGAALHVDERMEADIRLLPLDAR